MKTKKAQEFYDGEGVLLADDAATDGPVWNQLAKQGTFAGHVAGPFKIDLDTLQEIVANFKATKNRRVPVDYEHCSEQDPTSGSIPLHGAPATGWVVDLKIEDGNLWGLVDWSEQAKKQIREGAYRFISPAIVFGKKDRVTGRPCGAFLSSAGLVNTPFLDGMAPMAAKDKSALLPHHHIERVRGALEEHKECTGAECLRMQSCAEGLLGCYTGPAYEGGIELSDRLVRAEGEASKATLLLRERDATIETQRAELVTLREEKARRHDADVVAAVEQAFLTYKDARKLTDAQKPHLLRFAKADLAGFHALYPPVPTHQTYLMRDIVPPAPREKPEANESAADSTKRIMKNEDLSYAAAIIRSAVGPR
jgi:phage I-like protein